MARLSRNRSTFAPGKRVARLPGSVGARDGPLRLFFALAPDDALRSGLAGLARGVALQARGRPTSAPNLHLTLAFLGDVERPRLPELEIIGVTAADLAPPFELTLERVGGFRGSGIAWAGTESIPAVLLALVATLNAALGAAAFPVEARPFHPHVTLARRCTRLPGPTATKPLAWRVDRMVLMASETRPEGPVYREIAAWPLTGPPAMGPATGLPGPTAPRS